MRTERERKQGRERREATKKGGSVCLGPNGKGRCAGTDGRNRRREGGASVLTNCRCASMHGVGGRKGALNQS